MVSIATRRLQAIIVSPLHFVTRMTDLLCPTRLTRYMGWASTKCSKSTHLQSQLCMKRIMLEISTLL